MAPCLKAAVAGIDGGLRLKPLMSQSLHMGDDVHNRNTAATLLLYRAVTESLRNLGTKTILFAGVNTDQCVLHSLTDANFLGYGCLLVGDCCATTSPGYCVEATLFNVKKCFDFVTHSSNVVEAISGVGPTA